MKFHCIYKGAVVDIINVLQTPNDIYVAYIDASNNLLTDKIFRGNPNDSVLTIATSGTYSA